jgi:hypothetical protein
MKNCYNCNNRLYSIFSGRSIEQDTCRVACLVDGDGCKYCTVIMRYNPIVKTNCPMWEQRRTLWDKIKGILDT